MAPGRLFFSREVSSGGQRDYRAGGRDGSTAARGPGAALATLSAVANSPRKLPLWGRDSLLGAPPRNGMPAAAGFGNSGTGGSRGAVSAGKGQVQYDRS